MKMNRFFATSGRRLPSPAMVVACIALAVALGGTSYAAIRLPANSVGTTQLKRGAVTAVKVRGNSLTGMQINEASLAKVPFADQATNAATADTATRAPVTRLDYQSAVAAAAGRRATRDAGESGLSIWPERRRRRCESDRTRSTETSRTRSPLARTAWGVERLLDRCPKHDGLGRLRASRLDDAVSQSTQEPARHRRGRAPN